MNRSSPQYTAELASFAANATLATIPSAFQALLPTFILDITSAMLTGLVQPVYRSSVEAVGITYGRGSVDRVSVSIDGTTSSLSGTMLLMGIAAGDFEFEHVIQNAHPASAMFPALLQVASTYHKTGEEFLVAMAVDYELATRIGAASTGKVESIRGFHNPGLNGDLATAAAVGRLMGWDAETIASAMGIAASNSAGLLAFVSTGAMTKGLHPARAGQIGAEAAFMAHAGIVGPENVLENPDGFLHAFSQDPKPKLLTDGLGSHWTGQNMILKLSPVHAYAQVFVYAINSHRTRTNQMWNAENIESVTVHSGPSVLSPSHHIPHPDTLVSAQYSVPFAIAAALAVDLRDPLQMNDALLANKTAQSISGAMQFVQNSLNSMGGFLTIHMGGQTINITADEYPGMPGNTGYVDAAKNKYERVVTALDITAEGTTLLAKINSVAGLEDISDFLGAMVEAGSAAGKNFDP